MSYSGFSDFSYNRFNSSALDSYEPSPEFLNIASQDDAPNWVLSTYYWGTLWLSLINIATAAGQIYTKMTCSHFDDPTGSTVFEVLAWITIIFSLLLFAMSIYALVKKVGFTGQISMIYKNTVKKSRNFDNQFRLNELRGNMTDQQEKLMMAMPPSNLQSSLDIDSTAYADISTS